MFRRTILSLAIGIGANSISSVVNAQSSIDIGTNDIPGSSTGSGTDWIVKGSGSDIWGSTDHFHYLHFNHTGDATVSCLVKSFTGTTNSWRKGGIMFRKFVDGTETNTEAAARSPHSMIELTGWGIAHQSRTCENCGSVSAHDHYDTSNVWLRLVKEGNTITSYVKRDGDYDYMLFNSLEGVDLGDSYYVGLAITSHDQTVLGELDVSNFEISNEAWTLPNNAAATEVGDTGHNSIWIQQVGEGVWAIDAAGVDIGVSSLPLLLVQLSFRTVLFVEYLSKLYIISYNLHLPIFMHTNQGTADSFGFFDSLQTGDVAATLQLEKVVRRHANTKGGLMMRASHAVDSAHVSLLVCPDGGVTMFWRETAGGETQSHTAGVMQEHVLLRLVKTGNSVECSYKHPGQTNWFVLGTATAEFDSVGGYYVGQAITSANYGQHARLTGSAVEITLA